MRVIRLLSHRMLADDAPVRPGAASAQEIAGAALGIDSDTSSLTFMSKPTKLAKQTQLAYRSRPTCMDGIIKPPPPPPRRCASRVSSFSSDSETTSQLASSTSSGSFQSCISQEEMQPLAPTAWAQPEVADLPDHLIDALAFASANGAQDWCPTAGLFLARYAHVEPYLAAQPTIAGVLTATALLVATKLVEGRRCSMRRFAPIFAEILRRTGHIVPDPGTLYRRLRTMEAGFLADIKFSISAPRHTVAWYAQAIAQRRHLIAQAGVSLDEAVLRHAIARSFPATAHASQSHDQAF